MSDNSDTLIKSLLLFLHPIFISQTKNQVFRNIQTENTFFTFLSTSKKMVSGYILLPNNYVLKINKIKSYLLQTLAKYLGFPSSRYIYFHWKQSQIPLDSPSILLNKHTCI